MKIAVLSGKGGTGKTFVSVNLATCAQDSTYLDCDVEEPNGYLFFKPKNVEDEEVFTLIPEFYKNKCTGCRKCVDFCRFNALAFIKDIPTVFSEVCHSCGGCEIICPYHAVSMKKKSIGKIQTGTRNNTTVVTGILNLGEASGVPIIKSVLKKSNNNGLTIIDCPPGSACTVMESIHNADYCILVAEPTLFGLHNFKMVKELVKLMNKPFGVIINKFETADNPIEGYCKENDIKILARIPYSESLANLSANGKIACDLDVHLKNLFENILRNLKIEVQK